MQLFSQKDLSSPVWATLCPWMEKLSHWPSLPNSTNPIGGTRTHSTSVSHCENAVFAFIIVVVVVVVVVVIIIIIFNIIIFIFIIIIIISWKAVTLPFGVTIFVYMYI